MTADPVSLKPVLSRARWNFRLKKYGRETYPAEDLLHDTYIAALQSIRSRGPPTQPFRWLRGIARYLRYQHGRSPSWRSIAIEPRTLDTALDKLCSAERLSMIRFGSRGSKELDGYVLEEHYGFGRSYVELSEELGVSPGSLRTRAYRARQSAKEVLDGDAEEDS